MNFKILGVLLSFGLAACAQNPIKIESEKTVKSAEQAEVDQFNLPKQELTASILFDLLLGRRHYSGMISKLRLEATSS